MVRVWHDEHDKFKSISELLMDGFLLNLVYFAHPGNTKRQRDLEFMYDSFGPDSKINLWCEKNVTVDDKIDEQPPRKKY